MGHKHDKSEILEGALATAFAEGISHLTYGRVAKRLGVSDRIVVYYFPSKEDLVGEVLVAIGLELQQTLAPMFRAPVADHIELIRTAWPVLARREADPVFALFFEAAGLAAAGNEPYRSLVPLLVTAWVDWATDFIEGTPAVRRAEAEAAIATIDGLLMFRQLAGPDAADRAARRLTRRPR